MIDIFALWERFRGEVNTWQQGFARPEDFTGWLQDEAAVYHTELFAEWEKNRTVDSVLALPFHKSMNLILTAAFGKPYDTAVFPSDYGYLDSVKVFARPEKKVGCLACNEAGGMLNVCGNSGKELSDKEVCDMLDDPEAIEKAKKNAGADLKECPAEKVTTDRWSAANDHPTRKVEFSSPLITIHQGGFKIAPKKLAVVQLNYFKKPGKYQLPYTAGANDTFVYQPGNLGAGFTNIVEFEEQSIKILLQRIAKRYAKFTGNDALFAMSENENKGL